MLTPRDLARAHDRWIAALWRGDGGDVRDFGVWLESHFAADPRPEPHSVPDAVSRHGAAGVGVRWYAAGPVILGYAEGQPRGCYRIPITAIPPVVHPVWHPVWDSDGAGSWEDIDPTAHRPGVAAGDSVGG